ncbi:uncharacterized protein LOC135829549 [Sycon ciliatum]|uniref:uncharacterized protein LOC135829549 n=1 Tax=Sycon ciliatum TaxID=27933 RepID=UPI0020ADD8DB|eukprot:scpid75871/ scgid33943/ 
MGTRWSVEVFLTLLSIGGIVTVWSEGDTNVTTCSTLEDCSAAGECVDGKCKCDPGWTGESCGRLDLSPQANRASGAAWNSHNSSNSSWCITAPRTDKDELGYSSFTKSGTNVTFHIFVSQMVPGCGLGTWLPGSRIVHATSNKGVEGPYEWENQVFSSFHHNPHLTRASDGTWLLYFNGRHWPEDDFNLHTCHQNSTCPSTSGFWEGDYWHGGGDCKSDGDCKFTANTGVLSPSEHLRGVSRGSSCVKGHCQCEHHYFGSHCEHLTETVNLAYADSLDGPWTKLLEDGAAFFDDGIESLHLSNPVAWPLANGTVIMAYSRAPNLGIAVAPHWKGPYTRLYLTTATGEKNYSLINPDGMFNNTLEKGGEDPFLYQDARGTWHVLFHGYGGDKRWTDGQAAHSSDLLHWTWQPEPAYSSTIQFQDGTAETLSRRERPAVAVDKSGAPLYLLNGVEPAYPGNSHTYSYIHATSASRQ